MARIAPLLVVTDLTRSIEFYRHLGFEPATAWDTYAKLMTTDGSSLHLATPGEPPADRHTVALAAPEPDSTGVTSLMVIEVGDCEVVTGRLSRAGLPLLSRPTVPPWGGEVRAFLRDPDGHLIELNQPT